MKRIFASSSVCKCVSSSVVAPRSRSSAAAIAMINHSTATTSSSTTTSHRLFHHQFRAMEGVKQIENIDFSSKSVSEFINQLNEMKVEPMEKRTTDKTREQLYYLYSVEHHIQKEIETFQQQVDAILNESSTTTTQNNDEAISGLKSRFSLLLKWVLAIQQLTLDNGLYKLVQPLLIGEKAEKFLQVLLEEPHVGKSHNFPIYYSLTVLKAKVRASIALGDYETARVACEQLLTKISQVRAFYEKRRAEVEKEEKEAATIGIAVEQYRKNQRQLKARDSVEEVVNKIYELQQEQDITFPSSRKAPEFDIYFGIEPITANIEAQLERMQVETQIINVQVLYNIAMNEGSANSILAWLDSKLRDAKLLGTFSNVIFKVSKASILAIQGDQQEEAIKLFVEAQQQMTKSYAAISKDLQQLSTIALNLLLYSTKKRNPALDIHAYMKMIKPDNTETTPQVKNYVTLVLIDLFTSRGQLDAALNYIAQAKEIHFNNGYFSPVYASLLRREAEALILSEQAAPHEIISLLDNAIDLRVEQYGSKDRYLPIFYDVLVNYCQQNKIDHEKLSEYSSELRKANIPVLKREEIFFPKADLSERNL
ncbi:hypothetical protein C9374_000286 [Naegleria lovaniensis]|uniref:Uncharacterized protein n=1 Tax=Naegleria lovaniensis TaxID=51637 RepID=A0AA88GXF7_NAELO|nr:uncharacterized protein C9374_000286 [Naegleria lovaniensis]KAG2388847.1 hypothetical protein C9374_000286 [Naegleria lovaniensis]